MCSNMRTSAVTTNSCLANISAIFNTNIKIIEPPMIFPNNRNDMEIGFASSPTTCSGKSAKNGSKYSWKCPLNPRALKPRYCTYKKVVTPSARVVLISRVGSSIKGNKKTKLQISTKKKSAATKTNA